MDNDKNKLSDYSAIGLDRHFMPIASPITSGSNFVKTVDWDIYHPRDTVTSEHIRNFSFNSGVGGTLVLGGTNNGNGVLQVKSSSGGTIVTANNAGITITGGNILVKNSSNTTIIDTAGIVSTANFANDQITDATLRTTTSTSPTDIPGATMTPFVVTRATRGLVSLGAFAYNNAFSTPNGYSMQLSCVDSVNGTLISYPVSSAWNIVNIDFVGQSWTTQDTTIWSTLTAIIPFSAGTHTLKLQFNANSGGTAKINFYLLDYILLGS